MRPIPMTGTLLLLASLIGVAFAQQTVTAWFRSDGESVEERQVAEAAAASDFVLLGEVHDNPHHHETQLRLLEALVAAGRRPALVFEMLDESDGEDVAAHLAEEGATADSLAALVEWEESGWPDWAFYRPLFQFAIDQGLPVVAANLNKAGTRLAASEGLERLATKRGWPDLSLEEAGKEIQRDAVFFGHCELVPRAHLEPMVAVQMARDLAFAQALLAADSGEGAVLIAGSGHTRKDAGVPFFLERLRPDATILAIGQSERESLDAAAGGEHVYDFLAITLPIERPDPCAALRERFKQ